MVSTPTEKSAILNYFPNPVKMRGV